jgi:tetratricopeptide (TPR) repeat protein
VWILLALELANTGGWVHGRPADCAKVEEDRGKSVWSRAKDPELSHYCIDMARAVGELSADAPDMPRVLAALDSADRERPDQAVTMAVRGVVLAAAPKPDLALAAFEKARAKDARALDEPFVALAYARLLSGRGDLKAAADIYRGLVVRATLPPREADAMRWEAGMVLMATGPAGLAQSTAILREGRERATVRYADAFDLALALALDRGERPDDAAPKASAAARTLDPAVERSLTVLGLGFEAHALRGSSARDPKLGRDAYKRFLAERGDKSPWAEHARSRAAEPRKPEPRR